MLVKTLQDVVVVQAPAKVNLFLEVPGKRADGFHEINTFMAPVSLFDTLRFREERSNEIIITSNDRTLPTGPENLIWRAAQLLRQSQRLSKGVRVHVTKRIPQMAGLAGGSSDAAATLRGLCRLWNLKVQDNELARIARKLGSDVPFFLAGQPAWCRGRGEKVKPARLLKPLNLLVVCPERGLSTAAVYRKLKVPKRLVDELEFRKAIATGEVEKIGQQLHNRLQPDAEKLCPEITELRQMMNECMLPGHIMSGSGSSYVGLCKSRWAARELARRLRNQEIKDRFRFFVVRTLDSTDLCL